MIAIGRGEGRAVMGQAGRHVCPSCKEEAGIDAVVVYRYAHLWWLFSFLTSRNYYLVCEKCQAAVAVDEATAKAQCPDDRIPFIRRRGWMLGLGLVALIMVYSATARWLDGRRVDRYLAAPLTGDLYIANMVRVENSGFTTDNPDIKNGRAFGGLLFLGIDDDDDRVFATTMRAYDSERGARRYLDGKAENLEFDFEGLVYLTGQRVQDLRNQRVIIDILRGGSFLPQPGPDEESDEPGEDGSGAADGTGTPLAASPASGN